MVFNKVDRFESEDFVRQWLVQYPRAVAVSARTGAGFPALMAELGAALRPIREFLDLSIPHSAPAAIARLHAVGQVIERDYEGETARFKARLPPHFHAEFAPFIVSEQP